MDNLVERAFIAIMDEVEAQDGFVEDARRIARAIIPIVMEEAATIAEKFSRMMDKPDHADAPKLIAHMLRSSEIAGLSKESE